MKMKEYFSKPISASQRIYEALRLHYMENVSIRDAALRYNLNQTKLLEESQNAHMSLKDGIDPFFIERKRGPKKRHKAIHVKDTVVSLRKKNYSILDIKASLEAMNIKISHETINELLKEEGFARLPRRKNEDRQCLAVPKTILAPRSIELDYKNEQFSTGRSGGILAFLPLIEELGIIKAIKQSGFPETSSISAESYVLSFLALKLIGNKRLSHDESWTFDRVLGFFAGLNVLPKNSSMSSYSYRISRECNRKFLSALSKIFDTNDGSCDFNLDFKTIPYWGDEDTLEKNYSTVRGKAVRSVLALIVQNISNNSLTYTNAEITHNNQNDAIIEFVDFWKENHETTPKMLIFDSQFTIYQNLKKLDESNIKFLTLRRRRDKMLQHAREISKEKWEKISVDGGKRKERSVDVYEETIRLPKYEGELRQMIIIDHSGEYVFMITNDFTTPAAILIRKYGQRWLVEQEIAEQIAFFHLNQLSSSIVVKVDFDLTMTLLAHNLYRYLAKHIERHENCTVATLHRLFIEGRANVQMTKKHAHVSLSKRSHSPLLFEVPWMQKKTKLSWRGLDIDFSIGTSS